MRRDSVLIALFYNILMEEQNNTIASVEAPVDAANVQPAVDAAPKKKKVTRSRKKVVAPEAKEETKNEAAPEEKIEEPAVENKTAEKKPEKASKKETVKEVEKPVEKPAVKPIPKMPKNLVIRDFCDLANSGGYIPLLSDQQIQQLTYEEAYERDLIFEAIISNVLDYDIVLSDTNIWLELLVGHTSSHSDPRVNARLMFERQLEFISKMCKKIGGKFTIMSETYEEVDRFATMQEPTDYKLADWKDPALCLNVAARLAKRLMLYQQKENRLRIEGIGSESHHSSFADPAIIRRTVELFTAIYRWETEHTVINGRRLKFEGTGGSLFGQWIKWMLLSIITCGIYSFWVQIKLKKWQVKHTHFAN